VRSRLATVRAVEPYDSRTVQGRLSEIFGVETVRKWVNQADVMTLKVEAQDDPSFVPCPVGG
jgi:hypothetical protein